MIYFPEDTNSCFIVENEYENVIFERYIGRDNVIEYLEELEELIKFVENYEYKEEEE